jgi:hypothetical protein
MNRHVITLVAILLAGCFLGAQSVASVAKKNRKESDGKKSRIVITDEVLKSSAAKPADNQSKPASPAHTSGVGVHQSTSQEQREKEYYDSFLDSLKAIDDAQAGVKQAEKELYEAQKNYSRYPTNSLTTMGAKSRLDQASKSLETAKTRQAGAEEHLENLKQKAHRDDVPAGVFRQAEDDYKLIKSGGRPSR